MYFVDLSNTPIFMIWTGIIVILNAYGFLKLQSRYSAINLGFSLMLLFFHLNFKEAFANWGWNATCDLVFLAVSISLYLYINDVEIRRKVISEVFENKYKRRSQK